MITSISHYFGGTLLYGTQNGEIRRLEFIDDRFQSVLIVRGHEHSIEDLSFLRDGTIISLCIASHFRVWNQQVEKQASYSLSHCIQRMLIEPFVFSLHKEKLEIVEICSGKHVKTIYSSNDSLFISFVVCGGVGNNNRGGMLLITSHVDGSLQFWNLAPLLVSYIPQEKNYK